MKKRVIISVILLVLFILIILASVNIYYHRRTFTVDSGIEGMVLLGPICPVQSIPPDPACADKPTSASFEVRDARTGKLVLNTSSDTNGHFRINLQPGIYQLKSKSMQLGERIKPLNVTVRPNEFEKVSLDVDTGIR